MPGKNSKQNIPKVESAPVEVAPPQQQKGGKKVSKVVKQEAAPVEVAPPVEPVDVAPVVAAKPKAQRGGKKAAETPKVEAVVSEPAKVEAVAPKKGGAKKAVGQKTAPKKAVAKKAETKEDGEPGEEENSDRHMRSFKVLLPGKQDFEGRFTGLTPYQAANKALSKYFRETKEPKAEVTFSICESTRKSKKSVYTYVGKRQKLDTPVTYKIQDGREIVKNFKNSLKKVKKADVAAESASA